MQTKIKNFFLKAKQYIKTHPKATILYGMSFLIFVSFFVGFAAPIMKIGAQIINGEVQNTLTFNQLTGIVLTMAGALIFLLTLVWVNVMLRLGDSIAKEETQKLQTNSDKESRSE